MSAAGFFVAFLVVGLLLLGAEIFVPGGILGAIGALALMGAVAAGFVAFPGYGVYLAMTICVLVGISVYLWARYFPRSRVGRQMTVESDLADAKAGDRTLARFLGMEGDALSDLRPAGFVSLGGQRVDVVTRGMLIPAGTRVRVVAVQGNQVVVGKVRGEEERA